MERLVPLITFFAEHPLAAFVVALAFIAPCFFPVYSGRQKTYLLPCSVCWLAFGLWIFYLLGQDAEPVMAINPVLFMVLLSIASLGAIIVIKGLVQKPVASCSIE